MGGHPLYTTLNYQNDGVLRVYTCSTPFSLGLYVKGGCMLNFTFKDVPNIEQYAKDIGASGTQILVDPLKMSSMYALISAETASAGQIASTYFYYGSKRQYTDPDSKEDLIQTLINCGCNYSNFCLKGSDKESVDKTRILNPLLLKLSGKLNNGCMDKDVEDAALVLTSYLDYKSLKTLKSSAKAKLGRMSTEEYEGNNNKKLKAVRFMYEQKETGRFYTRDDSIQNWPLELCHAITTEKDYFLLWCDFDQIDFRVGYHLYLREPGSEADKIYLAADDKYRAMYEIICRSAGQEPDFELFLKYRKAYKKAILSAMYNASEQSLIADIQNKTLGHQLYEFFQYNARYQNFRRTIDRAINFGMEVVVSDYFQFQRTIPVPENCNQHILNDIVSKCCNTPIQSTSNSIMLLWLERVLAEFEKLGYSRERDIVPYLIRHDECIFKVHKDVMKDLWKMADCMSLAIDNWDILTLEPHCGYYYKEPDEELEKAYINCADKNKERFTPRTSNTARDTIYRPIQEVMDVYLYDTRSPKTVVESCLSLHPELDLSGYSSSDAHTWNDEEIMHFLKFAGEEIDPCYERYLKYHNYMIVYSHKLNKYRCVPGINYVLSIAKKIGACKINCFNLTSSQVRMENEIIYKFRDDCGDFVKSVFKVMEEHNFTTDWVSLNEVT